MNGPVNEISSSVTEKCCNLNDANKNTNDRMGEGRPVSKKKEKKIIRVRGFGSHSKTSYIDSHIER